MVARCPAVMGKSVDFSFFLINGPSSMDGPMDRPWPFLLFTVATGAIVEWNLRRWMVSQLSSVASSRESGRSRRVGETRSERRPSTQSCSLEASRLLCRQVFYYCRTAQGSVHCTRLPCQLAPPSTKRSLHLSAAHLSVSQPVPSVLYLAMVSKILFWSAFGIAPPSAERYL